MHAASHSRRYWERESHTACPWQLSLRYFALISPSDPNFDETTSSTGGCISVAGSLDGSIVADWGAWTFCHADVSPVLSWSLNLPSFLSATTTTLLSERLSWAGIERACQALCKVCISAVKQWRLTATGLRLISNLDELSGARMKAYLSRISTWNQAFQLNSGNPHAGPG